MRIVFCLASLGSGGAERVVSLLANRMDEMGHEVEIVCLKFNDVYYKTNDGVKVTLAKQQVKSGLSEMFWLRKHIKAANPEAVIAFTEGVYCFTIAALLGTRIPVIASERLDPSAMTWKRRALKRLLLPFANHLVVQTQSIKAYFPKNIQKKTSVIYNPVNEEVFRTIDNGDLTIDNKLNRIISVARLYPQKNQQMMIRAFGKIANEYPDWQLVIFGEGPLRDSLELMVESLGLKGRVLLPGRTEHVIEELRKSKIFCLSSDYEGLSNSMLEAFCVGLPIISTKVSGSEELVENEVNGYLVGLGDVARMADIMEKMIQKKELLAHMGDNNIHKALSFSVDCIVQKWIGVIRSVTT